MRDSVRRGVQEGSLPRVQDCPGELKKIVQVIIVMINEVQHDDGHYHFGDHENDNIVTENAV